MSSTIEPAPVAMPEQGFTLLLRGLPRWAERHVVILKAGETIEWEEELQAAVIVLEFGDVVHETYGGHELRLEEGAVFCLSRLPVAAVRNAGRGVVVLAGVKRDASGARHLRRDVARSRG